jgi:signal transduction histidine kinase
MEGRDLETAKELARRAALALDNSRLYREAQDAVRAREAILAVVSHDLRNPLNAIGMSTLLLLKRSLQNPLMRKQLETIQRAARQMQRLIGDLLDTSSIQAGRLGVRQAAHDGDSLVTEAIELNESIGAEKGVVIEGDYALEGLQLWCDRDRVLQVFANLLGNAVKFCQRGERVTVSARRERDQVHIEVSDTGPGMGEEELRHIFEPYWSGERHRKKGTGLGLFITKGILEAHGGSISVQSTPGNGSTFHFTLPVAPAS